MAPDINRETHEILSDFAYIRKRLIRNFFTMVELALRAEKEGELLVDNDAWNHSFPNQRYYKILGKNCSLGLIIGVQLNPQVVDERDRTDDEKELAYMFGVVNSDDCFVFTYVSSADEGFQKLDVLDKLKLEEGYKKGSIGTRDVMFIFVPNDQIPEGLNIERFDSNNSK